MTDIIKLKAENPDGQKLWDTRLAVGVGEIFFESDNIVTSDGEAFRLSGHSFDHIGKKRAHPTNPVECCADANPKTMLPNDT